MLRGGWFIIKRDSILSRCWSTAWTGIGTLAQGFWTTSIPFPRDYVVSGAKVVVADLLGFAESEILAVINCGRNFKAAAKSVQVQTQKKQW